jgi:hypothetical protein
VEAGSDRVETLELGHHLRPSLSRGCGRVMSLAALGGWAGGPGLRWTGDRAAGKHRRRPGGLTSCWSMRTARESRIPEGVIARGRWFSREKLQQALEARRRNASRSDDPLNVR